MNYNTEEDSDHPIIVRYSNRSDQQDVLASFSLHSSRPEVSAAAAFPRSALPGSQHGLAPLITALLQVKSPRVISPLSSAGLAKIVRRRNPWMTPSSFRTALAPVRPWFSLSSASLSSSRPSPPSSLSQPSPLPCPGAWSR